MQSASVPVRPKPQNWRSPVSNAQQCELDRMSDRTSLVAAAPAAEELATLMLDLNGHIVPFFRICSSGKVQACVCVVGESEC